MDRLSKLELGYTKGSGSRGGRVSIWLLCGIREESCHKTFHYEERDLFRPTVWTRFLPSLSDPKEID